MPDRYGENAERTAEYPEPSVADRYAIANCDLCDNDGMRGIHRCDHIDHAAAARRGMDMIRATMGWKTYCQRCGIPHAGNCKREENR